MFVKWLEGHFEKLSLLDLHSCFVQVTGGFFKGLGAPAPAETVWGSALGDCFGLVEELTMWGVKI